VLTEQETSRDEHAELVLLRYEVSRGDAGDIGLTKDDFVCPGYAGLYSAWIEAKNAGFAASLDGLAEFVSEHLANNEPVVVAVSAVQACPGSILSEGAARSTLRGLKHARIKRKASDAADRFKERLADPFATLDEEAKKLHDDLDELIPPPYSTMGEDVASIVHSEMDAIQNNRKLFFPTAMPEVDNKWGGLSNEGVTLILARSGHGKTTMANRLYFGMSCNGFGVHLHGTETSREQRLRDIMYSVASLNQIEARSSRDKEATLQRLNDAARMVAGFPGDVTGAGLTLDEICTKIRVGVMAGRTEVAICDYVQDIAPSGAEMRLPRPEFVGKCSQTLKDLSAELHIPIVLFAQASKPTLQEARANPRPGMYDAQWSSKLPQDAEECFVMYNDAAMVAEYGDAWRPVSLPGCIELLKRKARRTALGGIELTFDGNIRWLGEPVPL